MPVMLNPQSKRALLEQSIMCTSRFEKLFYTPTKVFPKVLLAHRSYINLARSYNMYRFAMEPLEDDPRGQQNHERRVRVWFEDHKYSQSLIVVMPFNLARELFLLLDPKFFIGKPTEHRDLELIVNLMTESDCKILLRFCSYYGVISADLLTHIWLRIAEIELSAHQLPDLDGLPHHHFDELVVFWILSIHDLVRCLRHATKKLELYIDFEFDANWIPGQIGIEINESVKECHVFFSWPDRTKPISTRIITSLSKLSKITISAEADNPRWADFVEDIEDVLDNFKSVNDLMALIEDTQIESVQFDIDQCAHVDSDERRYDWIARIKEVGPAFKHTIIEEHTESEDYYTVYYTDVLFKRETERISANFRVFHWCYEPRGYEEINLLDDDALNDDAMDDSE